MKDRELMAALVKRRHRLGLSQAELARRLGIAQPNIVRLEKCERSPLLGTFLAWADALEVGVALVDLGELLEV